MKGERLTDEELDLLRTVPHLNPLWKRVVDELQTRRAADLTPAEVAVLRDAVWLLCSPWGSSGADEKSAATALSKLLGDGEVGDEV
jgi:hypothetical protein